MVFVPSLTTSVIVAPTSPVPLTLTPAALSPFTTLGALMATVVFVEVVLPVAVLPAVSVAVTSNVNVPSARLLVSMPEIDQVPSSPTVA